VSTWNWIGAIAAAAAFLGLLLVVARFLRDTSEITKFVDRLFPTVVLVLIATGVALGSSDLSETLHFIALVGVVVYYVVWVLVLRKGVRRKELERAVDKDKVA
jgi:hypothetical protein